jgi:hypothetical protein
MFSVEFGEGIVSKAVPNPFQHNDVSVAVKFSCVKTCQDAQPGSRRIAECAAANSRPRRLN